MRKALGGITAAVLFAALPVGLLPAPAGAQPYPPGSCQLALSVSVAVPGETIVASTVNCDSGYAAGAEVTLTLNSEPFFLDTVLAALNGQFSTPVTMPPNATLGAHTVQSSGLGANGSTLVLEAGITLVAPGGAGAAAGAGGKGGGQLAFTGGWVLVLVAIALVSLTVGTTLVVGSRRRSQVRRQFSS